MSDPVLDEMLAEALWPSGTLDVDGGAITADDVRFMHRKLDELGAPRLCDAGLPLSLRWRLIALTKSGA